MNVIQENLPGFFPNWSFWTKNDPQFPLSAWQAAFENLPTATQLGYIPDYQALKDGSFANGEMWSVGNYDENALPVELSVFAAKYDKIEKDIDLRWRTETEVNNAFFDLYRRILKNGEEISPTEKLGRIDGHGNSNSPKEYSFEDKPESIQPGMTFEYTLRQTDNDGTFEDSKLELKINESDIGMNYRLSQNYPNPFNPSTKISYEIPENSVVDITVYDMQGQKIETIENGKRDAGSYTVDINLGNYGNYASGPYIVQFVAETSKGEVKSDIKKILMLK